MDILKNKQYISYDYTSRYQYTPIYYNTEDKEWLTGLGANVFKNTNWVAHKVTQEDTLDNLALKYYGNPTYWWVIAYYNDIQDSFVYLYNDFDIIKIPNIAGLEFGNERH